MEIRLPKEILDRAKAETFSFFGVDVHDMTREELIACCVKGWRRAEVSSGEASAAIIREMDSLSAVRVSRSSGGKVRATACTSML